MDTAWLLNGIDYADANTGRGTNDKKSITGVGLISVGVVVILAVGEDGLGEFLDVGSVIKIVVRGTEGDAGGEELERHEGLLDDQNRKQTHRSVFEKGLL